MGLIGKMVTCQKGAARGGMSEVGQKGTPEGGGSSVGVELEKKWHGGDQKGCTVGRSTERSQKEAPTARSKERGRIEP